MLYHNIHAGCFASCPNPKCLSDPGDKRKTWNITTETQLNTGSKKAKGIYRQSSKRINSEHLIHFKLSQVQIP